MHHAPELWHRGRPGQLELPPEVGERAVGGERADEERAGAGVVQRVPSRVAAVQVKYVGESVLSLPLDRVVVR